MTNAEIHDFTEIRALHPDWTGHLLVSRSRNVLIHKETGARATFKRAGGALFVDWERYPPETFRAAAGFLVKAGMTFPDAASLRILRLASLDLRVASVSVDVPHTNYSVALRPDASDLDVFRQVFVEREYDSAQLPSSVRTIVDVGANTGLATVFFGLKYPDARIVAVEPEAANFGVMTRNVDRLGSRVSAHQAAIWSRDGTINLHRASASGQDLGSWGVQVAEHTGMSSYEVACHRLDTLIEQAGLSEIDIVKIDVEGAEIEIFDCEHRTWLDRTDLIIIETHDRFRPGSEAAVRRALSGRFVERPSRGENLFFSRIV